MASQVNRDFFKKAKKVDRAIEIRDNEAVIPAVKERAEVRARLPNRRLLTIEERASDKEEKKGQLEVLEEEIEVERKILLESVKVYESTKSGASEVVAQNLKVQGLMEKRSMISRPEKWIETLSGLTLRDIFSSKRDDRKIGAEVFQIKRRVEPILSLYVDMEGTSGATSGATSAAASGAISAAASGVTAVVPATAAATVAAPRTAAEVAEGVIIGKQKRILKSKKTAAAPAGAVTFSL
jgi:hypothetical protein